jgi:dCTP deaminase
MTGIFPCQSIRAMVGSGQILGDIDPDQIQPASLDLRLGDIAYPVTTSFLPGHGKSVLDKMRRLDPNIEDYKISLNNGNGALLEKGRVYVIPLMESIKLPQDVAAFANPKSSTGRLDILTRLITDQATVFDQVDCGYEGRLYLEVAPRSFSVVVKAGERLNQIRFRTGLGDIHVAVSTAIWKKILEEGQVVDSAGTDFLANNQTGSLPFHVDLIGSGKEGALIGWRARQNAGRVDLSRRDYDPLDFWEPITFRKEPSLVLDPDSFYILMTKEAIAVPPDFAAEMLPYDTRAGEFRVHYAGFFDPGFGWNPQTGKAGSSRGVLEVRSHQVPFLLEHGQLVGWLRYDLMAARPEKLYGHDMASNYQGQSLKLAKQFLADTSR